MKTILETLTETGGFTYNLSGSGYVTSGYAVSADPDRSRTFAYPVDEIELSRYVYDNQVILSRGDKVLGGWLDTETGITYLDVVTITHDRQEAFNIAKEHGEIAIFDLDTHEEIRV